RGAPAVETREFAPAPGPAPEPVAEFTPEPVAELTPEPVAEFTPEPLVELTPAPTVAPVLTGISTPPPPIRVLAEDSEAVRGAEFAAAGPEPSAVPVLPGRESQPMERAEMARVDADLLDTMLNNAGEVSIFRAR